MNLLPNVLQENHLAVACLSYRVSSRSVGQLSENLSQNASYKEGQE